MTDGFTIGCSPPVGDQRRRQRAIGERAVATRERDSVMTSEWQASGDVCHRLAIPERHHRVTTSASGTAVRERRGFAVMAQPGMIEWMHAQLAEERMMLWRVDIPVDVRCGDGISQLTAKATEVATRRREQ